MKDLIAELLPNVLFWMVLIGAFRARRPGFLRPAAIALAILSIPYLPATALRLWTPDTPDIATLDAEPGTVVLVMGGGVSGNLELGFWPSTKTLERVRVGAYLAQRDDLPILISGGFTDEAAPSEAAVAKLYLRQLDYTGPITLDETALNTWDTAVALKELMRDHDWQSVIAVSSPIHLRRVRASLRGAGIPVAAIVSARAKPPEFKLFQLVPRVAGITMWRDLGYEVAGSIGYILQGRITTADLL